MSAGVIGRNFIRYAADAGEFAGGQALELGEHEAIEVAVKDIGGRARLVVGAVVLDHLVGMQDVRADLVAPACLDVLTA